MVFTIGDALGDALVRPAHVVVHLVFSQDGAQMAFPEDQHAVQDLTAQGTDESLADRVHPRSLDSRAQDPGASSLEDGVERGSEVRSAIADQEPDVLEPLTVGEGEVAGLLHCPVPGRVRGDAAQVHPAGTVLDEHQHICASAARYPRAGNRPRGSRQPRRRPGRPSRARARARGSRRSSTTRIVFSSGVRYRPAIGSHGARSRARSCWLARLIHCPTAVSRSFPAAVNAHSAIATRQASG